MIDATYLRSVVRYDVDTGVFVRIRRTSNFARLNVPLGSHHNRGYLSFSVGSKLHLAHRLACYRGVRRAHNSDGWQAIITKNGKCRCLGTFETPEQAARVRDAAARELHGEFARLNF